MRLKNSFKIMPIKTGFKSHGFLHPNPVLKKSTGLSFLAVPCDPKSNGPLAPVCTTINLLKDLTCNGPIREKKEKKIQH